MTVTFVDRGSGASEKHLVYFAGQENSLCVLRHRLLGKRV